MEYDATLQTDGQLKVVLLNATPDPERAIATAARLCYAPVGAEELLETIDDKTIRSVLTTILESGHLSALEHASFTFAIEGVSRALTHQLVRHRLASFNQQSQRYVRYENELDFVIPPSIGGDPELLARYREAIEATAQAYRELLECGVPAEDARYLLPNATESKIVVTMNARELLHFFSLRCCNRAQWEIRQLAWAMLDLVRPTAPIIFGDAGPACVRGACSEGKMSCGKPYPRRRRGVDF